jgi:hypothetical protein
MARALSQPGIYLLILPSIEFTLDSTGWSTLSIGAANGRTRSFARTAIESARLQLSSIVGWRMASAGGCGVARTNRLAGTEFKTDKAAASELKSQRHLQLPRIADRGADDWGLDVPDRGIRLAELGRIENVECFGAEL